MSARFVYWMNVSVDLFIERGPNEHSDLDGPDWVLIDETLHREFNERARRLSMMVQGRVVYELMDPFWPNARDDESMPDYLREYGHIWTDKPKVLVSRTRIEAGHNTRVIGADGDAIDELRKLRDEGEGDIGVGGSNLATQLLEAGLLDELLFFVHPSLLGAGRPLFERGEVLGAAGPRLLQLLEQKAFVSGVVMHRYGFVSA